MLEIRKHIIGDLEYGLILPPPTVAMPLVNRVATLLGPLLTTLSADVESGGMKKLASALMSMDPLAVHNLFMDSVSASRLCVNNEPLSTITSFDKHFSGHRADVYEVCVWCTWECVKDFFPNLEGISQVAMTEFKTAFQSPKDGQ